MKNKIKLLYLFLLSLGSHPSLFAKENIPPFDWIPEPASQSLCEGHYASPSHFSFSAEELRTLPIVISANKTDFAFEGASLLQGEVTLKQGDRLLHADNVLIKRSPVTHEWDELIAEGNIEFFTPGALVWGDQAIYYHTNQHFHIDNTYYRWYPKQARGQAKSIDICQSGTLQFKEAEYTTCSPLSDTWILKAKDITLYPKKGYATAKHVRLHWLNVPIIYLPYINYPIDNKRHSGFLFPSYGSTSNSGTELAVPYYWNMAPNYDLMLVGHWLSERGAQMQTTFRYLLSGEGYLQWYILPHDRKYEAFSQNNLLSPPQGLNPGDPRILALNTSDSRNAINYRHSAHLDEHWQFNILFDYVTDDNYFVDLGNDIHTASTIHLPQKADLRYYGENWTHYFNVEEYQVLQPLSKPINDEIYRRQPQWSFQALYPEQLFNFSVGLLGEAVNFTHPQPDIVTKTTVTVGQRYHLRPSISLPFQNSWYFFIPRYQLDWLSYSLSMGENADLLDLSNHPTRTIPLYDLDMGLLYERDLIYYQYRFSQTLEPRLYYLYVPYRNQNLYPNFDSGIINFSYNQLFRDNRFSGHDRVGDTNQLTLSLTSRLLPKDGGQEWLRASIGQIFYFAPQRVFLCEEENSSVICLISEDPVQLAGQSTTPSNLIGQVDFHPHPQWSGSLFWEWDPNHMQSEQAAVNIQYNPSFQKIINFNYYWQLEDFAQFDASTQTMGSLNQAEMSIFWPLTKRWQWLARWHYNLVQHQTIELLGGFEYNGCCVAFQFIGSRYLQSGNFFFPDPYATGAFFQIVFKGLGSFPFHNPDGVLKEKIPGYTPLRNRHERLTASSAELL